MRLTLLENRPGSWAGVLAVLVLFLCTGSLLYRHADGQDLASSYVGARMLATGQAQHLFNYDPQDFSEIGDDDAWIDVGHSGGFFGFLHPYVQTPLWAYLLQPLARHLTFLQFDHLFTVLTMLAFAGTLWLISRYWAVSFFNPLAVALVAALLMLSQPFQYAMFLTQTHMLLLVLVVAALILAERDWPVLAGLLLAYAASVKVTPAFLILYWLVMRRWKAAASAVFWSAVLWGLSLAAVGQGLMGVYLDNLHRISRILLVSQNNQSLAAWWMARFYPSDAVWDIDILPLPAGLRLVSTGLILLFTVWGGWLDRRRQVLRGAEHVAPLGAMMAITAATLFAPIAWTHYFVILFIPLMLLVDANRVPGARWLWVAIGLILLLNYRPVATDIVHGLIGHMSILRGQFYAGALTLAVLSAVATQQARRVPRVHGA